MTGYAILCDRAVGENYASPGGVRVFSARTSLPATNRWREARSPRRESFRGRLLMVEAASERVWVQVIDVDVAADDFTLLNKKIRPVEL
jgi:hypothetical protein